MLSRQVHLTPLQLSRTHIPTFSTGTWYITRHSARLVRRPNVNVNGGRGGAELAMCNARVGAAARTAVGTAADLASECEEGTAHFVPETMGQVCDNFMHFPKSTTGVNF